MEIKLVCPFNSTYLKRIGKRYSVFISTLITLLFFTVLSSKASTMVPHNSSYAQSSIDSLVSLEMQEQINTQLIDYKIKDATNEALKACVMEENSRLSYIAILITVVSLLMAIVAVAVPLSVNKRYEKLIDERLKDNKEVIDKYIKDSQNKVQQLIADGLQKVNLSLDSSVNKLVAQQIFSIRLIRALTNKDDDVKLNMLNEIIKEYNEDSNVAYAFNSRGSIYLARDKYDYAISDYTKAIKINPLFADAYYNRGNTYMKNDNIKNAIEDYIKAIELNPNGADYYYQRGKAFLIKGNNETAIEDFTTAIGLNPDCPDYYCVRGRTYFMSENFNKAIDNYSKAIILNPNKAEGYYLRGEAYLSTGKTKKAKRDFDKARELGLEI